MLFTLFINDTTVEVAMEDIVLKQAGKSECYFLAFALFTKNDLTCYILDPVKRSQQVSSLSQATLVTLLLTIMKLQ